MENIARFLFEAGILKRTPRSGWHFLPGASDESVAEHSFRATLIAWTLAQLDGDADPARTTELALVHDLAEARTGDLNYVHQKYATVDETRAEADLARDLPFEADLRALLAEYRDRSTPESLLAHDADQLEMLLSLKERLDGGVTAAGEWIPAVQGRLHSATARRLAEAILTGNTQDWWYDRGAAWWVSRSDPTDDHADPED
jgi:putative hydrolase of HD superfamily